MYKSGNMGGRMLFLWLILMAFAVVQSKNNSGKGKNNNCTSEQVIKIMKSKTERNFFLLCGQDSYYKCSTTPDIKKFQIDVKYKRLNQCNTAIKKAEKALREAESSFSHKVIGFGAVIALLLILLLVVTGGWVWTCWILQKTTEISIKPKSSARVLHQYNELPLQPDNSTSFQPSINYSLLNPKYDSSHFSQSQLSRSEMEEEEQIYEVLDGEDNRLETAKARGGGGDKRGVAISGDKNGPYSKLEYSENLQDN